jgi:hypothetical protein
MSISDGQRIRALESNAAWCSKTANNTILGVQTLSNAGSGPSIPNLQLKVNELNDDLVIVESDITNLQNDVATLQAIPTFKYIGGWDASTNTPTLADGDDGNGFGTAAVYRVTVSGTVDFGSGPITFNTGDRAVYNFAGVWEKWDVTEELEQKLKVEYRTITSGEATAKQLTLAVEPLTADEVMLDVKGGAIQFLGDDFTVTGDILDWDGLGLDGILVAGDKLRIAYNYI